MTPILVPDAQTRASLAAIRSLGRAGYRVHAVSADKFALGLKSRFADAASLHPAYDTPAFPDWLSTYVARHGIEMIVPSEGLLRAIRPAFEEFKALLPVTHDQSALYRGFSKIETVRAFMAADPALGLMNHHPASTVVDLSRPPGPDSLPPSSTGYFVKAEAAKAGAAPVAALGFASDSDKAIALLADMSEGWDAALVQEACSGVQIGVSVLMDNGEALAVSCVRDCHPRPHSNGTMSLRESCWLPEIAEDTIRRLAHLEWRGCAMGEYRYEPETGEFNLIEINFRYWQYLHLDLWAGMDFPRYQAEWFLDGKKDFGAAPQLGVKCRDTWPGEAAQLVNEIRRRELSRHAKLAAIIRFAGRFLNPTIHQDFNFPGDRAMYFRNLSQYIRSEFESLTRHR
jgi:hypothetical protein